MFDNLSDVQKLKIKAENCDYRFKKAFAKYTSYNGKDTAEEHRLFLCWINAEQSKITAEKKLLAYQTQLLNAAQ